MGELKAGLPLGTSTVLEQCINLFKTCGIDDLVVVTGHQSEKTGTITERAGARVAYNPEFASGMYSSIHTGVSHIVKPSDGFFILPVDIPLVRSGTVRLLTGTYAAGCADNVRIVYPAFSGKRGHPPLISGQLIATILDNDRLKGGLRTLLADIEKKQPQQVVEVEVPDANILFDMDTPEDYTAGLARFSRLGYPTMEECSTLLKLHPMPEKGLAHGRLVGRIAVAFCLAVMQKNHRILDPDLCRVCGLLHDIAKGHPSHEKEGGRWLQALGFARAAEIIAAHKDIAWQPGDSITEKELVHLADKMARGSRIVNIQERFTEKLALYKDNPEATRAIQYRHEQARQLAAAVMLATGQRPEDILSQAPPPCNPSSI